MKISREQYFKDIARALLKGYFAGLNETRAEKKNLSDGAVIPIRQKFKRTVK